MALVVLGTVLLAVCGCGGSAATNNPTPQITGLIPSEITAGSQSFTLFVSGTQFISTTTVQWNGADVPTSFDQVSGELLATIPAADVQAPGKAQLTVTSPAPGGRSFAAAFTINPAQNGGPTITSLSPSSAAVNSQAFTLTVMGTNFSCSDYVTWNGGVRTPPAGATCSSTQLTAQIFATDLTLAQTASVSVHTSQLGVASPSASFQVGSSKSAAARFPQLVSVTPRKAAADGQSSSPAISIDGRYVAFYSTAKNLVAGGAAGNVFLRDTCLGQAASCTQSTIPVDVAANGETPNGGAGDHISISADGRYVAFASSATNLTHAPIAGAAFSRIFVRDMCVGTLAIAPCSPRTEVASVDLNGNVIAGTEPSISADGRFVAFTTRGSIGSALVAGARNAGSTNVVMVRDTCHGAGAACTPTAVVASIDGPKRIAVDPNVASAISASGRYVAFVSAANAATPSQVFVRDTCQGADAACIPATTLISAARNGADANAESGSPAISADGRFIVFASAASNLADDSAGGHRIYVRDTCAGPSAPFGCTPSTTQISSNSILAGEASASYSPAVSPSGRYISFVVHADSSDSAAGAATTGYIVIYDTCFGATGPCSPHASELNAEDSSGNEMPLTGDIRVPVPVTDGGFAAFFTQQAVPTLRVSGLGDVFLTTTAFHQ